MQQAPCPLWGGVFTKDKTQCVVVQFRLSSFKSLFLRRML
jgi:hypothetical protein